MSRFGYQSDFLGDTFVVPLPEIGTELMHAVAPVLGAEQPFLYYQKYTVVMHAPRRMALFTACNIDGTIFQSIRRSDLFHGKDQWTKDPRISPRHQWGAELYRAVKSDFDKGHLVKREDAQWGTTTMEARDASMQTFFYTNAAPQHGKLNRGVWRKIEDYILHKEAVDHGAKVSIFTGPVLQDDDPIFVSQVDGESVRIPALFWKVIYFVSKGKKGLCRVGFLVGQEELLHKDEIVKPKVKSRSIGQKEAELFADFALADTYQVHPTFIESLTGLRFTDAIDPIEQDRRNHVVLKEVQVRSRGLGGSDVAQGDQSLPVIEGLSL